MTCWITCDTATIEQLWQEWIYWAFLKISRVQPDIYNNKKLHFSPFEEKPLILQWMEQRCVTYVCC